MLDDFTLGYPDWYSYDNADNLENDICDDEDDFDPFYDEAKERKIEAKAFEAIPKHGVHAHAYKKELDNLKIKKLREKGYSYRKIADQLGCSPKTIKNRLSKLEEVVDSSKNDVADDHFDLFGSYSDAIEDEKRAFHSKEKHGIYAPAYKKNLNNMAMWSLRKKGYSYREIARRLSCSPSTVRNRLNQMGVIDL